ncbi:MAG: hypothetical protein KC445_22050, partial [Anaerolineales bacterium]|nr:hypothetical protein [Anaerolineales bacterium]
MRTPATARWEDLAPAGRVPRSSKTAPQQGVPLEAHLYGRITQLTTLERQRPFPTQLLPGIRPFRLE